MGGSMGLAIRNADPSIEVIGVDTEEALSVALSTGAISSGSTDPTRVVGSADVVLIAAPPSECLVVLEEISSFLAPGTVVSDMCSVKRPICQLSSQVLDRDVLFVGGHPMTGSEKRGIRHADGLLFENASYVLCPVNDTHLSHPVAYANLKQTIGLSGARILEMDAQKHDRIAANVSHVPQLLSVLLVNLAGNARQTDPEVLLLAAGGFRDMTRIASSPFPMWREILEGNDDEIIAALEQYEHQIARLKEQLTNGDFAYLQDQFHQAEQTRDFIPIDRKGFLRPLADVYVFTSDRPGALVEITGALFRSELSIKDIELLRIREGTGGTFRLGFHSSAEANKAVEVLNDTGFSAYRL
jgi:prephenate dehydrogenase